MKKIYIFISVCGLLLTVLPAFFVFSNLLSWKIQVNLMLIGTVLWFFTAPLWMKKTD